MGAAARPLDEGPLPVILYERNRSFAEGRKGRLPLHDCVVSTFLTAGCSCFFFIMALLLWSTGPSWSLVDVLFTVMLLMLVGLSVFLAVATVAAFRGRARLQTDGRLLVGEVTEVAEDSDHVYTGQGGFAKVFGIRVFYRFRTPAGDERNGQLWLGGQHSATHWSADHRPLPRRRDSLAILYADGVRELVM